MLVYALLNIYVLQILPMEAPR